MLRGVLAGPVRDVRVEGRRRDEARRVGRPYVRAEDQARPGERRPRHEAPRRQHAGVPGVRVARRGRPVRTGRGGLRRRQAPTSVRPVVRVLLGGGRALAQAGRVADPPGRVRLGGRLGVRRRRVGRDGPRPQGEQAQGGDRAGGHVPSGPGRAEHGVERPYRTDTERDREADETERAGARGEPPDVDPERGGAADGPRPRLPPVERLRGSDHAPGGVRAQAGPADPALGRLQRRRARPGLPGRLLHDVLHERSLGGRHRGVLRGNGRRGRSARPGLGGARHAQGDVPRRRGVPRGSHVAAVQGVQLDGPERRARRPDRRPRPAAVRPHDALLLDRRPRLGRPGRVAHREERLPLAGDR
mmetsp:Transcript_14078/g.32377  ORF Transcript_14078/g.32377 Transcript_14078/m.32377 type:complete len:359 (-) Transcript_14078:1319-2395(-)